MRTFALAYYCKTEGVHDIAKVVAFICDPSEHNRFGGCRAEVLDAIYYVDEFSHDAGSVLRPALFDILGIIFCGRCEEEFSLVPQVFHEVYSSLDEGYCAG